MTQTPSNAPKAEIDQLKAIQDRAKEANNMALTNATAHFHKLVDEIRAFQARATTQDAKNEAEALIRAFENDIAYLKQEIQKAKTNKQAQVIKELEWVKYVIGGQKTVNTTADATAPVATIAVAQKAPEAITVDMDAEATKYIQNFQKEAVGAFKEAIQDKDGNLTTLSLRRGLEFMQDVSKLSADWIEKDEKEVLSKHIPAVQGILGGIFMETLLRFGYAVGFNGDGNVVLKGKANVYEVQKEINDAIKRDSNLSQILRSGVLHMDGDLLKYMQASSTSQGKGILPEQQTPAEFLKYLHNRSGETQASDIIKNSVNFFKGMDLPAQMVSANAIPEISRELKALTPEERVLIQNTVNAAATGAAAGATANGVPVMSRGAAMAQAVGAANESMKPKSAEELWDRFQKRPFVTFFTETTALGLGTLNQIFKSEQAIAGAALLFAVSWLIFDFKKAAQITFGGAFALALWDRYGKETKETESALPDASATELKQGRVRIHGQEVELKANELMVNFKNVSNEEILKYLNGDKNVSLTEEQKKLLDDPVNAEIVKKDIEGMKNKIGEKISETWKQMNLSAEEINKQIAELNDLSVRELENWAFSDPAKIKEFTKPGNIKPGGVEFSGKQKEGFEWLWEYGAEWWAIILGLLVLRKLIKWWKNAYEVNKVRKFLETVSEKNEWRKTSNSKAQANKWESKTTWKEKVGSMREKAGSMIAGKELNANTNNAEPKTNVDNSKAKPDTTKYRHIGAQSNNLNLDGQTQAELEKKMAQVDEKMKGSKDKMVELEKAKTIDIKKEQVEAILGEINRQKQWLEVEMNRETLLLKKNLPEHMASDIDKYISSIRDVRMQELDAMEAKAKNILDRIEKAKKASSSVLDNLDTIKTIDGVNVTLSGEKLKKYNKLQEEFKGFDKVKGVKISDNAAVNAMNEINELFKDDKLAVENINTIKQAFLDKPEKFDEFLKKILKKAG